MGKKNLFLEMHLKQFWLIVSVCGGADGGEDNERAAISLIMFL